MRFWRFVPFRQPVDRRDLLAETPGFHTLLSYMERVNLERDVPAAFGYG